MGAGCDSPAVISATTYRNPSMSSSLPISREFEKLATCALEVLSRVEQLKLEAEEVLLQAGVRIADVQPLVIEADRLIKKVRELRAELEDPSQRDYVVLTSVTP